MMKVMTGANVVVNADESYDDDSKDLSLSAPPLNTREEIEAAYGKWFCETVGIENLEKMPTVTAASLHVDARQKYHTYKNLAGHLQGVSAVKFFDGGLRPGIAIEVRGYDYDNEMYVRFVELIYKRYSINGDGGKGKMWEHNYVSGLYNKCDDGKVRESYIYHSGATHDFSKLRLLLNGEPVTTTLMSNPLGVRFMEKV